jgi:hypothetical protein
MRQLIKQTVTAIAGILFLIASFSLTIFLMHITL